MAQCVKMEPGDPPPVPDSRRITVGYALRVPKLLACPFCRALFPEGETDTCPDCAVALQPLDKLPPSLDVQAEEADESALVPPEHRVLPWSYFGRGRGALLALGVLGLVTFFMPWVVLRMPELINLSGFDLARGRAGWLWGGAVGWFILLPLVWTRRSIAKMRGVRIICSMFAAMTLGEVIMMMSLPPGGGRYRPVDFSWGWGMYASALVSIVALGFAIRFGGRADDVPDVPWTDPRGRRRVESSEGETLH
jgi:hypothetical protein